MISKPPTPAFRSGRCAFLKTALLFLAVTPLPFAATLAPSLTLMPMPADIQLGQARLTVPSSGVVLSLAGPENARLHRGLSRALRRWEERTGATFERSPDGKFVFAAAPDRAVISIEYQQPGAEYPKLGDDESYTLQVGATGVRLRASTDVGVLRGFETILQLLQGDASGWFLPAVEVRDEPRFPWRGLMIDVCRHWQPLDVIKRNLDGMAVVKLNVLHLHLSEDQGFRVESKTHPELQNQGSDGHYFTQDQLREIIAYAADRGIRVVPEFDIPGHATSWVVSHPELASAPGPYVVERRWGVCDPVLDPTNEKVYALLDDVLGEMASLFPDAYFHIGGDENNGKQWSANAGIQKFIRDHNLKDNEGLHAYFNRRIRDILTKHGKKLVGWDEILHPDLPKDAVIHSWRGPKGLSAAATQGYSAILSNGYYIDLSQHADFHYANDPVPADSKLSADEQKRILGGEATMWGEWISPETIDSRIWPRTAAIAERLWSPRTVTDVSDMYRRLPMISQRLEEAGLNHERNRPVMIRRLMGTDASAAEVDAVTTLIDVIEPVKQYHRGQQQPGFTQHTPLNTLADCARPESEVARQFRENERLFLASVARGFAPEAREAKQSPEVFVALQTQLQEWQQAGDVAAAFFNRRPREGGGLAVAQTITVISKIAARALESLHSTETHLDDAWRATQLAALDRAAKSHDAIEIPIVDSVRNLVTATAK